MKPLLIRFILLTSFCLLSLSNSSAESVEEVKTRWDKVPFRLYQEQTNFKSNHLMDNKVVNSNFGVRTYALPKNLPVRIISKSYFNGEGSYYVQLPDGSLGYVPWYALDETIVKYSNNWTGTAEHFSGWSRKEKKVGEETYLKYEWEQPDVTVRTDKGIKKTTLNHVLVTTQAAKHYETEEDRHISGHIIIIKNPEDIKNLVGYDKKYVERRFGKAKNFAGDALTEVGYAYSYYQNMAIESYPDKYKVYGLAIYYNKDMQVVDAAFLTSVDGRFRKETVRKLKMPKRPGSLCSRVNVASGHQKVSGLPVYNIKQKHQSYEVTEPTYIYSMLRYPEKIWHLGLAAACIALLLTGIGYIEQKISKKEDSIFEVICYIFIGSLWLYITIIYLPNGLISALIKSCIFLLICISPISLITITFNSHKVERYVPTCPYCNAPESFYAIDKRVLSTYKHTTNKEEYIKSSYETVYNDNFEQDLANTTPYKPVWTSMILENKLYREVRIIKHIERYECRYRCKSCRKEWDSGVLERTVKTETEYGNEYWVNGGYSDVKSFDPKCWEVIDQAKHNLRK